MTTLEFLATFSEVLGIEHEPLLEKKLADLEEWDSLGLVSFLSMADIYFQKSLSIDTVKNAQSVEDLYRLLQD